MEVVCSAWGFFETLVMTMYVLTFDDCSETSALEYAKMRLTLQ